MKHEPTALVDPDGVNARREFLKKCGRFAAVTPPAITMLLAVASKPTEARASTIGWLRHRRGNNQDE